MDMCFNINSPLTVALSPHIGTTHATNKFNIIPYLI